MCICYTRKLYFLDLHGKLFPYWTGYNRDMYVQTYSYPSAGNQLWLNAPRKCIFPYSVGKSDKELSQRLWMKWCWNKGKEIMKDISFIWGWFEWNKISMDMDDRKWTSSLVHHGTAYCCRRMKLSENWPETSCHRRLFILCNWCFHCWYIGVIV